MKESCLVVLSGGQDSTTCLYWAKRHFKDVHAVTFNYNQRHSIEIESAKTIAERAGVASHEIIDLGPVLKSTSPLVNKEEQVGQYESAEDLPGGVEPTFVPGRNLLFLVIAANRAAVLGTKDLVTGVCQEDFGGYFDCRQIFIDKMGKAIEEGFYGTDGNLTIHTPLMDLTKEQSVVLAVSLEGCIEALAYSHTCYNGAQPPCGKCHACILRAKGFEEAGISDPLIERVDWHH